MNHIIRSVKTHASQICRKFQSKYAFLWATGANCRQHSAGLTTETYLFDFCTNLVDTKMASKLGNAHGDWRSSSNLTSVHQPDRTTYAVLWRPMSKPDEFDCCFLFAHTYVQIKVERKERSPCDPAWTQRGSIDRFIFAAKKRSRLFPYSIIFMISNA